MAASGRVVTIQDVVEQTGGMILPNQINGMDTSGSGGFTTSGWSTGLTLEYTGVYPYSVYYYPKGYFKVIPAYAITYYNGLLSGLFSGGLPTYSYQNVAWSAKVGTQVYSVFPNRKFIRLRVYEEIGGTANFEYFYLMDGTTTTLASKTWSGINGSWTGTLETTLNKLYTSNVLYMKFGGMNTTRRIHYSDNVISPGAWIYLGQYNGVNSSPGNGFASKTWIYSGVTRLKYGNGSFDDSTALFSMNTMEYIYRLNDISVGVAYSSSPTASLAASGSYKPSWTYPNVCDYSYSCSCDVDNECVYTT